MPVLDLDKNWLQTKNTDQSNFCQSLKIYDDEGKPEIIDPAIDERYMAISNLKKMPSLYDLILKSDIKSQVFGTHASKEVIKAARET